MAATKASILMSAISRETWSDAEAKMASLSRDSFTINMRQTNARRREDITCVIVDDWLVALGIAKFRVRSGDFDKQVHFSHVTKLDQPLNINELEIRLSPSAQSGFKWGIEENDRLTANVSGVLRNAIEDLVPQTEAVFTRLLALLAKTEFAPETLATVKEQRDATALGLEIAGLPSRELLATRVPVDGTMSFLEFLREHGRASEASTLRTDHRSFDGWSLEEGDIRDVVHFVDPEDPHRRVTVLYADKEHLERVTGTDLIYYRHHSPGFILVQYKRMRENSSANSGERWEYRPDPQLEEEISRMRGLIHESTADSLDDWRICPEPFYVKLVDDNVLRTGPNRLVSGMYFPLGLFELLLRDKRILGPRGGRAIGWHNVDRYLCNSEFLSLAKQGWIGSSGPATRQIEELVRDVVSRGRGALVVRDETDPDLAAPLRRGA